MFPLFRFDALPIAVALLALVGLGVYKLRQRSSRVHSPNRGQAGVGKARTQDREPGVWEPAVFDYPQVEPCTDDLNTIKPIPYRPFRWGEYQYAPNMSWNEWIEIDQNFVAHHRLREHRIRTRGERVVRVHDAQPGVVSSGRDAARELVYELAEYCQDDTRIFTMSHEGHERKGGFSWYGEGQIQTITVVPLQVTYDLEKEDAMTLSALLGSGIMIEAGAIIIPGSWRLSDKIGMPLDEIHVTGHVPQYQSKLHLSMSRFFRRLALDKPVVRNNYSFQLVGLPPCPDPEVVLDPTELAWCRTVHGDEDRDDFERRQSSVAPPAEAAGTAPRQTLRRLPRTGAIAFTIRVLASAARGWSEDVAQCVLFAFGAELAGVLMVGYKDVLPYLDERHKEQVEAGL
ncbi:uncharacterized protein B0H18DRAFT_968444, partial [Fomitopsis serialis]|uniref:uncharacterized protein n=1 Tax=Fomitopsis serialis TaxID=139415 RepID=UPI002008942A